MRCGLRHAHHAGVTVPGVASASVQSTTPHNTPGGSSKQPDANGRGAPAAAGPSANNSPAASGPTKPPVSAANFSFGGTSSVSAAKPQDDSQPGQPAASATASPAKFSFGAAANTAAKFSFGKPATSTAPAEPKKFNFGGSK